MLSLRRGRAIEATHPPEIFIGETGQLRLSTPQTTPGLTGRLDWPDGLRAHEEFRFSSAADGMQASVPFLAVRRGAWRLGTLWLKWPSRLGLFEFLPTLPVDLTFRVVPNIRQVQSGEITVNVLSSLFGVKENRAIGEGSEFHQLREFARGMDVKSIDWKRSAKSRRLLAKELRAERNHHVILAIDNGYLMGEEVAGLPRIDHAITAALATAWAATIGGDLVGFFSYDVRPRSFFAPAPGRLAFARLRSWTADLDYVGRATNHTLALSELNARTPKRSLIVVFTEFTDTTSAELLVENLVVLSKRHLIIFVALRDPDLDALVAQAPKDLDGAAKLVSANQALVERRLVFERLSRLGITVLDVRPGELTPRLVSAYLDIKARELI